MKTCFCGRDSHTPQPLWFVRSSLLCALTGLLVVACIGSPFGSVAAYAQTQDSTAALSKPKTKLTRAQILKLKVEDLLELSLEEVTELLEIAGVSSLDELINLIVTTASKSEEKLQDAPGIITVVTKQEIEGFGATSLWEVLDRVVSLYFIGTAVLPQNMLSVRGIAQENFNTQVLYLLDGRPFRESVASGYISPIVLGFPLGNIERVEIIRGPGSVLYGTCAYTGVVNIISKTDEVERFEASARYGSYNTFVGEITGGAKIGDLKISGGSYIYNTSGWPFTARGESDVNAAGQFLRNPTTVSYFSRNFGANLKAEYKGFTLTGYYGSVLQADMNANPTWAATTATATAANPIERANEINRLIIDLGYAAQVTSIWNTSLNITYNNLFYRFFRPVNTVLEDDIRRYTNDVVVEWTNYIKPIDKLNILVGALTNTQTGYALGLTTKSNGTTFALTSGRNPDPFFTIPNYNQTWFTGYFQADYRFLNDKLKLVAGGQLNQVTNIPLDFVPRLGAVANITDELRIKVLYGAAFRSASAFERETFSLPNIVGNRNLNPERINTLEAQVSYTTPDFDIALTYFNSNQTDIIRRTFPGDRTNPPFVIAPSRDTTFVPTFRNLGRLLTQGFELEGKWIITPALNLFGSMSYKVSSNSDIAAREDGFGMPTLMIKLGLMYTSKTLTAGVFNSYFGVGGDITALDAQGRPTTRIGNPPAQAFSNLSFNVTWDIGKTFGIDFLDGVGLNVYGNNLLDAQIYYPEYVRRIINTLPGRQGRSIYGGIKVSF
jgi:outer membrane receptor protein involved in Fe transport